MKLLTVTPNPSLDLLFEADSLVWDDANRLDDPRRRPGGQGINVARAARTFGTDATALALLGGDTGTDIAAALAAEGTPLLTVEAEGATRTFVAARERVTGRAMLLNARGPARSRMDGERLLAAATEALRRLKPDWLASCGSVPAGVGLDLHARLAAAGRAHGCRVVVDCDGAALSLAADSCDLLVPNQHEASRLARRAVETAEDALAVATALSRGGQRTVAITLGAAGAVLVHGGIRVRAVPPPIGGGSAVGAGDVFLAALLTSLHTGVGAVDALRDATAAGAATLLSKGSDLVRSSDAGALRGQVSVSVE